MLNTFHLFPRVFDHISVNDIMQSSSAWLPFLSGTESLSQEVYSQKQTNHLNDFKRLEDLVKDH